MKKKPISTIDRQIKYCETVFLTDIHSACTDRIAELSPVIQDQAMKFLQLVETLLAGITSIASEICWKYFEEINNCPKRHEELVSSRLERMALLINRDVDIIYEGLQLSTIDHMQRYIDREKSDPNREPYYTSDSDIPF